MSITSFLGLNIPDKNSKGRVVTDVFEPNFTKIDQNAEKMKTDIDKKLDKGNYVGTAEELNRKIEVNRNSIISLDDKVDSYENRFEDVVLWEGLHQTNGTITLSEPFTNFREIEVIVSSYASGGLDNIAHRRLLSKNIVFNDTDTADNKPNECRFGIDSDGNTGVMFKTVYFRLNKKDIYFGSRSSSCTISKITGIGRVK